MPGIHSGAEGSGQEVLLIHGIISDHRYFKKLISHSKFDFRFIWYDRRGYGESEGEEDLSVRTQGEDAAAVIRRHAAGPVILAAHSAGGKIALEVALRYPELVSGVVLVETPLAMTEEDLKRLNDWNAELNGYVSRKKVSQAIPALHRNIGLEEQNGSDKPLNTAQLKLLLKNLNAFMLGELNDIQNHYPTEEELRQLKMPVCMFVTDAKKDSIYTLSASAAAKILGWELQTVSGNHNVISKQPEEFAEKLQILIKKWS